MAILLDRLAQRYGGAPSDWRRKPLEDLSFDRHVLTVVERVERDRLRRMPKGSVQPVIVVGGA
jgi:hypothetical protein